MHHQCFPATVDNLDNSIGHLQFPSEPLEYDLDVKHLEKQTKNFISEMAYYSRSKNKYFFLYACSLSLCSKT